MKKYEKDYIVYHCHSDLSNANGFADSATKFADYIKLAKKNGMKAIAFSEHGNIYEWIKKKQACDKAGIKYIHGVELYLCNKLQDNDRGGHKGLYARNWSGILELNELVSIATSKGKLEDNSDRHTYYNPRISLEELMSTSDNIIVTTACLASPLWKWTAVERRNEYSELIRWMTKNKHRCFLEIQYHNHPEQKVFNKQLKFISEKTGIPLIAGTDTHSSTDYKAECRKILQKAKDNYYGDEDSFDLTWKTYDELVYKFKEQNAIDEETYLKAIHNTLEFANMVESFDLDKEFKYPTLYGDDVKKQWQKLINKKLKEKIEINAIDVSRLKEYQKSIYEEFNVMSTLGMESFMMFMSELNCWCLENSIPVGFGRGSVAGSTIAFITDITDVDPIRWKTVFSRFCNIDRISLGDIDSDYSPEDRAKVYEYIVNRFGSNKTAYITTFSTMKDRGCIDVLAKGLDYKDLSKVMDIKNHFDELFTAYNKIMQEEVNSEELVENGVLESGGVDFDNHDIYMSRINNPIARRKAEELKVSYEQLKSDNKDIFYYMDGLKGTIIAKGIHPSGMIGAPITVADNLGVYYRDGNLDMPVSSCSMKAVDSLNWVKFVILGLKTVGIIKDTCRYAGIPYPKSYEIDWADKKVWDNMIDIHVGCFQFESSFAHGLLSDFKPQTVNHMSMVNASLRPSGKSYRDRLIAGEFNYNPSEEIDNLLSDNNGFLIYQEDTIKFLTDVCNFTGSEADSCRRCVDENTLVLMDNGSYKKIKDIIVGDMVQSYNKFNISEPKEVVNVFNNGSKKTLLINTEHGYQLQCTTDHKVFTQRGWLETSSLTEQDYLMTPSNIYSTQDNLRSNQRLSEKEMLLIGMLLGDGCMGNNNTIHFTNSDNMLIDKYKECINSLSKSSQICTFNISKQKGVTVDEISTVYINKGESFQYYNNLHNLLSRFDLLQTANMKHIPIEFMNYPKGSKLLSLLGGLFSTDGGYNYSQSYIEYYSISVELVMQIKSLLLKYGIYSYVSQKYIEEYNYYTYTLVIRQPNSLQKFREVIKYMVGKKCEEFEHIIENASSNPNKYNYLLPDKCRVEILDACERNNISIMGIGEKHGYKGYKLSKDYNGINDYKARIFTNEIYCPYTYELLNSDFIPVKITSITESDISNVYDIEVKDNHNYIANGLIVHNCIGKKDKEGLQAMLPKILDGYCKHSPKPKEIAEQEAKQFVQIIADSSEYQFGLNHATAYSMNGYLCTSLRTHYPLEFTTAYLNRAENKDDIVNGIELAKHYGFEVKPILFGKSKGEYTFDKSDNKIYKGIGSIKYCNMAIAEELYNLSQDCNYTNFFDLLVDIQQKTSVNKRQLEILTILGFFEVFGRNQMLLNMIEIYNKLGSKLQINKSALPELGLDLSILEKYVGKETEKQYKNLDMLGYIKETSKNLENKSLPIQTQAENELKYLEYVAFTNEKLPEDTFIVYEYKTYADNTKPYVMLHSLKTGEDVKSKVTAGKLFASNPFKKLSILRIKFREQNKVKYINGERIKTEEIELIMKEWEVMQY